MADIRPHTSLTLLEAYQLARLHDMHLIDNGLGDVRISPIIPPGWREIPLKVKVESPTRGRVVCQGAAA